MKSAVSIVAIVSAIVLSPPAAFGQSGGTVGGPGGGAQSTQPGNTTNPSGGTVQSTTPPGAQLPAASSGGRTVGQAGRTSTVEEKPDPRVEETEREVSRRIKSICKGC